MIFIVDTNVIFSGLMKEGLTRRFLIDSPFILYAPETLISEIRKYERTIIERTGLTPKEFETLFGLLIESIRVVEKERYFHKIDEAERLIGGVDAKDVPFLALALAVSNDGIWSDDEHFQKQNEVKVWRTSDIVNLGENTD